MTGPPAPAWVSIVMAIALAPFIGSFLGVLIRRLPERQALVLSRSRCDHCRQTLAWPELIPLASFVFLGGRCRSCGARMAWFYPGVELASMAVPLTQALVAPIQDFAPARFWAGCLLGWALLALGWIDWERFLLPDVLTLPLVVAGLAVSWWLDPASLAEHAAAAICGYLGFVLLGLLYRTLRGRAGLGLGDAKLLAGAGAWLGLLGMLAALWAAAVVGVALAVVRFFAARRREGAARLAADTRLPFGTCLALSMWLVWLAG